MLKNYFKIALRNLRKHKGYTFINVAGLALGLGCCLLILTYVGHELRYDRFHEHAEVIYRLEPEVQNAEGGRRFARIGAPHGPAVAAAFPEVDGMVRFFDDRNVLVAREDIRSYEDRLLYADATVFDVFTFPLLRGDPASVLTAPYSVVLTEAAARKYFGEEDPVGQTLTIDQQNVFTVTGILAPVPKHSHVKFDLLASFETLNDLHGNLLEQRYGTMYHTYLRVPGPSAVASLEDKFPDFIAQTMGEQADLWTFYLNPLTDIHLHSHREYEFEANGNIREVYFFAAIAFIILLIACVNYMNLATARAARRAAEVGVRKALGADRRQLVQQFMSESLLLTGVALGVALLLMQLALPSVGDLVGRELQMPQSGLVLIAFIGLGLLVGVLAGTYPALYLSAFKPVRALKGGVSGQRASSLRRGLVVAQFAIATVLLIGTFVVSEQMAFVRDKDLGFSAEQVIAVPFQTTLRGADREQLYRAMKEQLLQQPGVLGVTASSDLPNHIPRGFSAWWEGVAEDAESYTNSIAVGYDFFDFYEIELVAGRTFSEDFPTDVEEAYVLNEAAARRTGWADPLGRSFEVSSLAERGTVIGVVKDFHFNSLHQAIAPLAFLVRTGFITHVSVKAAVDDVPATLAHLEATWEALNPDYPFTYFFIDDQFSQFYEADERAGQAFLYFAVLAIFIACLGLFGLVSFMAAQRTKEMGIRKVLGASAANLVVLLSKEFIKLVLVAYVLAAPLAYFIMDQWLRAFAYHTEIGVGLFLLAGGLAVFIAALTVSYQATKTALADPVKALRYE